MHQQHERPSLLWLLPAVLITEDASVDARFSGNPYVAGEPRIKFYAGAPLVGTGEPVRTLSSTHLHTRFIACLLGQVGQMEL